MKRIVPILLALCLCAGLWGVKAQENVTIEQLVSVNRRDAVFARHGSLLAHGEIGDTGTENQFYTKDLIYFQDHGYIVTPGEEWFYVERNGQKALYYKWYVMSDEEKAEITRPFESYVPILIEDLALLEKIRSVSDNGDGTLTVTAELNEDNTDKVMAATGMAKPRGMDYAYARYIYVVDARTLEIQSSQMFFVLGNNAYPQNAWTFTYDAKAPEDVPVALSLIAAIQAGKQKEPFTYTVVYDAGTDGEERFSCTLSADTGVYFQTRKTYDAVFTDAEMTAPLSASTTSISTLYLFSIENNVKGAEAAYAARDFEMALKRYQIAANLGSGEANAALGQMYEGGVGTERDVDKAAKYYRTAWEQGVKSTSDELIKLYQAGKITLEQMPEELWPER